VTNLQSLLYAVTLTNYDLGAPAGPLPRENPQAIVPFCLGLFNFGTLDDFSNFVDENNDYELFFDNNRCVLRIIVVHFFSVSVVIWMRYCFVFCAFLNQRRVLDDAETLDNLAVAPLLLPCLELDHPPGCTQHMQLLPLLQVCATPYLLTACSNSCQLDDLR
jgi:hypothetical protein